MCVCLSLPSYPGLTWKEREKIVLYKIIIIMIINFNNNTCLLRKGGRMESSNEGDKSVDEREGERE